MEDAAHERRGERVERLLGACVAFLAVLAFANTLGGGFVWDDVWIVAENPAIRGLAHVDRILTSPYWPETPSGLFRPVTLLSFAIEWEIHRLRPSACHATNVALHAAVALLAFLLARRVLRSPFAAFGAAALFALHPVHTEAVAPLVGRSDLLAALFVLAALLLLDRETGRQGGRRAARASAGCAFFALALLSKESAIVGLPLLLLLDLAGGRAADERPGASRSRGGLARRAGLYAILALVVAACLAWKTAVTGAVAVPLEGIHAIDNPLVEVGPAGRLFTGCRILGGYLLLLLFPIRLRYDYSYAQFPVSEDPWSLGVLASAAVIVALVAAAVASRRRSPGLFFGLGALGVGLLPVSNLVFPIGTIFAERLVYLPSVGFVIAAAAAVRGGAGLGRGGRPRGRGVAVLVGLVLVLMGARTLERNREWGSVDALYESGVRGSPRSARTHVELGKLLYNRARETGSPAERRALEDRAIRELETGIAIRADFDPVAHLGLGYLYEGRGRSAEAAAEFEAAARLAPWMPEAQLARLRALARAGRREALADAVRGLLADSALAEAGLPRAFWEATAGLLAALGERELERETRERALRAEKE